MGRRALLLAGVTAAAGIGLGALWARRRLVVVTVSGLSMAPTYQDGDRVLVRRRAPASVRADDVAVLRAPVPRTGWRGLAPLDGRIAGHTWNIKRIVAVPGDDVPHVALAATHPDRTVPARSLVVIGDHPASADSKQFGFVPDHQLLGVVVRQLRPHSR